MAHQHAVHRGMWGVTRAPKTEGDSVEIGRRRRREGSTTAGGVGVGAGVDARAHKSDDKRQPCEADKQNWPKTRCKAAN